MGTVIGLIVLLTAGGDGTLSSRRAVVVCQSERCEARLLAGEPSLTAGDCARTAGYLEEAEEAEEVERCSPDGVTVTLSAAGLLSSLAAL
jgi:hypothetical protein